VSIPHVFVEPRDLEAPGELLHAVPFDDLAAEVTVGVGPEGGLTAQEIMLTGLPAVSVGATVSGIGTASVVAPAVVLHRLGRLG
jgi:16S rRNA U1498 N3-methylase RsmE